MGNETSTPSPAIGMTKSDDADFLSVPFSFDSTDSANAEKMNKPAPATPSREEIFHNFLINACSPSHPMGSNQLQEESESNILVPADDGQQSRDVEEPPPAMPVPITHVGGKMYATGASNAMHQMALDAAWSPLRDALTSIPSARRDKVPSGPTPRAMTRHVDEKAWTPLMVACRHGAKFPADVARLLVVANVHAPSLPVPHVSKSSTPVSTSPTSIIHNGGEIYCLHVAVMSGCTHEVISVLNNANPDAAFHPDGNGNMPLHLAVTKGNYKSVVSEMHKRSIDEMEEEESDNETIASFSTLSTSATLSGTSMMDVCNVLIAANPEALHHRNKRGETPFLLAMYGKAPVDVLSLFIVRGEAAAIRIPDDFGSLPLHFCHRTQSLTILRELVDLYPDAVSKKNRIGETPLYYAMDDICSVDLVRIMLEACLEPSKVVKSKNRDDTSVIQFGWNDLKTQRLVPSEDQDEEDQRISDNANIIQHAHSCNDIVNTDVGVWWHKTSLLLKASFHNTVEIDHDTGIMFGDEKAWRPIHAVAGTPTECSPEFVKFVAQIHPEEAEDQDENGNTALHIATSFSNTVHVETIRILFDAYPLAALTKNNDGCTPLHIACLHRAPLEIIAVLTKLNPEAILVQNHMGQTPLFLAIAVSSSLDNVRLLLKTRPKVVHIPENTNTTPIALAWNMMLAGKPVNGIGGSERRSLDGVEGAAVSMEEIKRGKENRLALAVARTSASLLGDVQMWMGIIDVMLRAGFHDTVDHPLPGRIQWRAVHAASAGGFCPPDVLAFALQILPSESKIRNEDGNLPIHIASAAPPDEGIVAIEHQAGAAIDLLLKFNKPGVMSLDKHGRLPLHLACESPRCWSNGIASIVDDFPEGVFMRDPKTGLFPFMQAACIGTTTDESAIMQYVIELEVLNTVFNLLRLAPQLVLKRDGKAETLYLRRQQHVMKLEEKKLQRELAETKAQLRDRMSPDEVQAQDMSESQTEIQAQENECHMRNNEFEHTSTGFRKSSIQLEASIQKQKETFIPQ